MLFVKKNPSARDFDAAREVFMARIKSREKSFCVDTEFGTVFVEMTKNSLEPIYRYEMIGWSHAPINDETRFLIRSDEITHYCNMQRVSNDGIQEWMITMALTHMLIDYVTGSKYIATRDYVDAMALAYLNSRNIVNTRPGSMAGRYMKTISKPNPSIFRRTKDILTETSLFIENFFTERHDTAERILKKNKRTWKESSREMYSFSCGDQFYDAIFRLVVQEYHLRMKRGTDTFEVYKSLMEGPQVLSFPSFLKALVQGGTDTCGLPREI